MSLSRQLRVLHLPFNIASQISVTVRGLRDIGIAARGIAPQGVITSNTVIESLPSVTRRGALQAAPEYFVIAAKVVRRLRWADVAHWHFDRVLPRGLDIFFARKLGKKLFVEFWGSDIRIPEIEAADNPYYARAFPASEYHHSESMAESRRRQTEFARHSAQVIACISMFPYIQRDLFPNPHFVRQRIYLPDYTPRYPETSARPLVIHSPTAPVTKGTPAVEAAVAQLQPTHAFDYRRVQGMPHAEARELMRSCDIFLDQFVGGAHGLAALEAMAFGKPVVCFIKPSMAAQYPPDLPIVNATQETLPEVLAQLIENGRLRRELGERGRAYVERYHDARMLARQLVTIYEAS